MRLQREIYGAGALSGAARGFCLGVAAGVGAFSPFTAALVFSAPRLAVAATSWAPSLDAAATSCATALAVAATCFAPSLAASATTLASCFPASLTDLSLSPAR